MVSATLGDLRHAFYGGGSDVELAAMKAFYDAGITYLDVLGAAQAYHDGGLVTATLSKRSIIDVLRDSPTGTPGSKYCKEPDGVGTNTAYNTAGVHAAVHDLFTAYDGGDVLLAPVSPTAPWEFNSTFAFEEKVRIRGVGPATRVRPAAGMSTPLFELYVKTGASTGEQFGLQDMFLDGNHVNTADGCAGIRFEITGASPSADGIELGDAMPYLMNLIWAFWRNYGLYTTGSAGGLRATILGGVSQMRFMSCKGLWIHSSDSDYFGHIGSCHEECIYVDGASNNRITGKAFMSGYGTAGFPVGLTATQAKSALYMASGSESNSIRLEIQDAYGHGAELDTVKANLVELVTDTCGWASDGAVTQLAHLSMNGCEDNLISLVARERTASGAPSTPSADYILRFTGAANRGNHIRVAIKGARGGAAVTRRGRMTGVANATHVGNTFELPGFGALQVQSPGSGTTLTLDLMEGHKVIVNLPAGNITVGAPQADSYALGAELIILFKQDSVGARTVTMNAVFKLSTDSATGQVLNIDASANEYTSVRFMYDGTNWRQISALLINEA